MHYTLRPDRHADIARTLLERIYPQPLATAVHAAWLDAQVGLTVVTTGWDKHGLYETPDGVSITGFDPASDHTRATLTITPVGLPVPVDEAEIAALRWTPPQSPRSAQIQRILTEAIVAHDSGPHYGD